MKPSTSFDWGGRVLPLREQVLVVQVLRDLLATGGVLLLHGDLGAGKTTVVQRLLHAWGYRERVASPTFDLVRRYPVSSQFLVYHADFYRLGAVAIDPEAFDLPAPEPGRPPFEAVLAEWAAALRGSYPERWELFIDIPEDGQVGRRYRLEAVGQCTEAQWSSWLAAHPNAMRTTETDVLQEQTQEGRNHGG